MLYEQCETTGAKMPPDFRRSQPRKNEIGSSPITDAASICTMAKIREVETSTCLSLSFFDRSPHKDFLKTNSSATGEMSPARGHRSR